MIKRRFIMILAFLGLGLLLSTGFLTEKAAAALVSYFDDGSGDGSVNAWSINNNNGNYAGLDLYGRNVNYGPFTATAGAKLYFYTPDPDDPYLATAYGIVADKNSVNVGYINYDWDVGTSTTHDGLIVRDGHTDLIGGTSTNFNPTRLRLNDDGAHLNNNLAVDSNGDEDGGNIFRVNDNRIRAISGTSELILENGEVFVGTDLDGTLSVNDRHGLTIDADSTTLTGGTNSSTAYIDNNEAYISVGTDNAGDPEVTLIKATNTIDIGGSTTVTIGDTANNYVTVDSLTGTRVNGDLNAYAPDGGGAAGLGLGTITTPLGTTSGAYIGYDNGTNFNGLISAGMGTAVGSINYNTGAISGLATDGTNLMVGSIDMSSGTVNGLLTNNSGVMLISENMMTGGNAATLSLESATNATIHYFNDTSNTEYGLLANDSSVSVGSDNGAGTQYGLIANDTNVFVGSDIAGIQHGLTVDADSTTLTGGTNSSTAYIDNNEAYISVGTDTLPGGEVTLIRATNTTDVPGGSTTVTIGDTANNHVTVDSLNGTTVNGDLTVTGDLTVNGATFTNNGITNVVNIQTQTLETTGLATLNSAQVTNNLTVNGNTTLGNAITDATTVSGTLDVAGAATTHGITNTGNIATTTLSTTGNATIGGNETIAGTLGVTGLTTTHGITNTGNIATTTLTTTGNATIGGNETVAGTLDVTGATTTNSITNTGNIATDTLNTTGDTNIGGALFVSGATTLTGNLAANGTTNRIGAAGVSTNTITGINNSITATGTNTMTGNTNRITATTNNTIGVTGGSTITTTTAQVTALTADGGGLTATNGGDVSLVNATGHGLTISPTQAVLSGGTTSTTLTLNDTGATFRNTVTGGPARVSGVADGVDENDAVNVQQLNKVKETLEKTNMGVASVAALASIPPAVPGKTVAIGAGYGYFQQESAVAIGVRARVLENMSVSAGLGIGIGDNSNSTYTANAGFSWSF